MPSTTSPNCVEKDLYCWICKKPPQKDAKVQCTSCIRTYHKKCAIKLRDNLNGQWQCKECTKLEDSVKSCYISQFNLHRCLKLLYDRLIVDDEYKELNLLQHKDVVYAVNFAIVESKITDLRYKSTGDFLSDIFWMVHNLVTRESSERIKKTINSFVRYCKNECIFIDTCEFCYALTNIESPWFSSTCEKRHEVIWAKVMGFKYEPAKMMKVGKDSVTVQFFGDHKIGNVPLKYSKGYGEKFPNQNYCLTTKAKQEVQEYIVNLERSFKYTERSEKLDTPIKKSLSSTTTLEENSDTPINNRHVSSPSPEEKSDTLFNAGHRSTSTTSATADWVPNIRKTVIEMLDKNEEKFKPLISDFSSKEGEYQNKIKDLETTIHNQKAQHELVVRELKRKKWCDCCHEETQTPNKIFCSNSCGSKWYQDAVLSRDDDQQWSGGN